MKNAVTNIDLSSLAKEDTLIAESQSIKDKIDAIPSTDLSQVAKESTLTQGISEIKSAVTNIDLSTVAKESTLTNGVNELKTTIANIDLSSVAKQGDNKNATLTAIYKLLVGNDKPSQDIPEGVAERLALILEFFGIKPIEAYEFMTPEEVCSTLEEIMTTMDLNLTLEKAKEITNNTLNKG